MTEDTDIRRLDDDTVRQIAAGEVVERPASVVKELVENSLDADADRVDVTVEAGGTERIAVGDDGVGMSEADVRAAVREHTTSKIAGIDDLESGVATLGFRGEALHTIGAVSRTTITTKPRDGVGTGEATTSGGAATELRLAGGEVESVGPAGRPAGTTVEVADLFYNTPARRKYLKTTTTEFSHVNTVVTRYALANPDVAVSLTHGDREVFATSGRGDLQSALLSVYGRDVATSMIRVEGGSEGTADGTSEVSVSGYVSDPETTRSSREYLSTYVGGRYVRSSVVRDAVLSAYGGQLSAERYPFAVLFVDVPGEEVDVNVHPRKMEVRWGDEAGVRAAVESAVEDALLDHGLVRSSAPRGRSSPDEARIAPERGDSTADAAGRDSGDDEQAKLVSSETREQATLDAGADAAGGANVDAGESANSQSAGSANPETPPSAGASAPADESAGADAGSSANASASTDSGRTPAERSSAGASASAGADAPAGRSAVDDRTSHADRTSHVDRRTDADRKFDPATESGSLSGGATETPEFERLPRMDLLGQLHDTYLVAETQDGLVLVDQHAADERVNYERLRAAFADDATAQMLADPVTLELTAGEAAVFDDYREPLERLGFRAERAEPRSANGTSAGTASRTGDGDGSGREVVVRTAPTVLDETLDPELLRDALAEFVSTDPDDRGDTVEAVADDLLADLACYPSITGNTSLREGSAVELLRELDDCENPYACPHGRPVIVEFGEEEIGERFERDYPGHAGRREE